MTILTDKINLIVVLKDGYSKLPDKDQAFVLSLLSQYAKKGKLSDKQMFWAGKFASQIANGGQSVAVEMKQTEVGMQSTALCDHCGEPRDHRCLVCGEDNRSVEHRKSKFKVVS
jgi:hypothetical protein